MKTTAVVRFARDGFHRWPDAPAHRAYLAQPHRHLFHVEVTVPVAHDEREVEFHDLLDFARDAFPGGDMKAQSCETMARRLAETVSQRFHRWAKVSVFEDGEVGAVVEHVPPSFLIAREIGIDTAHRVPDHASKCCHLHGHRYTVQALARGPLAEAGEQRGMVLDFGFLKEEMLAVIDARFDHGTALWVDDPLVLAKFLTTEQVEAARPEVVEKGYCLLLDRNGSKLCLLLEVPTAENLARHWFGQLAPRVVARSQGLATLAAVRVWETPNCWASYPAEVTSC